MWVAGSQAKKQLGRVGRVGERMEWRQGLSVLVQNTPYCGASKEDKQSASKATSLRPDLKLLRLDISTPSLYNSFTTNIALKVNHLIGNANALPGRNGYEKNNSKKNNCCGLV